MCTCIFTGFSANARQVVPHRVLFSALLAFYTQRNHFPEYNSMEPYVTCSACVIQPISRELRSQGVVTCSAPPPPPTYANGYEHSTLTLGVARDGSGFVAGNPCLIFAYGEWRIGFQPRLVYTPML